MKYVRKCKNTQGNKDLSGLSFLVHRLETLIYCAKKLSFPLQISLVNVNFFEQISGLLRETEN